MFHPVAVCPLRCLQSIEFVQHTTQQQRLHPMPLMIVQSQCHRCGKWLPKDTLRFGIFVGAAPTRPWGIWGALHPSALTLTNSDPRQPFTEHWSLFGLAFRTPSTQPLATCRLSRSWWAIPGGLFRTLLHLVHSRTRFCRVQRCKAEDDTQRADAMVGYRLNTENVCRRCNLT